MGRLVFRSLFFLVALAACGQNIARQPDHSETLHLAKPAIYLYPEKAIDVTVKLKLDGQLVGTYPELDPVTGAWNVVAYPDGSMLDKLDGRKYSYLFWEGDSGAFAIDFSSGFVVAGSDVRPFFRKTLTKLGLSASEINDFIVYWYPVLRNNPYNLIHFAGKEYRRVAHLEISPQPDTELRVFMTYRALDSPIVVSAQKIAPLVRRGFTVVEWGGAGVK